MALDSVRGPTPQPSRMIRSNGEVLFMRDIIYNIKVIGNCPEGLSGLNVLLSDRYISLIDLDTLGVVPQTFNVVKFPRFSIKDMHNNVAVIKQDPAAFL